MGATGGDQVAGRSAVAAPWAWALPELCPMVPAAQPASAAPEQHSWSAEDGAQWEAELTARLASERCGSCGSSKITHSLRGRPMMQYIDWNARRSEELGWTVLTLSGCTNPGGKTCADCGADPEAALAPQTHPEPEPEPRPDAAALTAAAVRQNDGADGRPLWAVVDGYVLDVSEFFAVHPGNPPQFLKFATVNAMQMWNLPLDFH